MDIPVVVDDTDEVGIHSMAVEDNCRLGVPATLEEDNGSLHVNWLVDIRHLPVVEVGDVNPRWAVADLEVDVDPMAQVDGTASFVLVHALEGEGHNLQQEEGRSQGVLRDGSIAPILEDDTQELRLVSVDTMQEEPVQMKSQVVEGPSLLVVEDVVSREEVGTAQRSAADRTPFCLTSSTMN
jgi:hypothetical protein